MPNSLGPNGLQTKTQSEILSELVTAMESIYGADINVDPDTPDGQMLAIFTQMILDNLDLITQVYNQFNPDLAFAKVLDQRVAINGIQRQAGTRTITNITITTNGAVTLYGADQEVEPIYTVADDEGNEWQLITTEAIGSSGDHILVFMAAEPGEVLTTPNTITNPVTIVLGVTAINNPTPLTTLGINEETDQDLKLRRQRSVSLASQGYLAGLLAELENISGINSAFVYENNSSTTDGDGIPGHSIWVIISGSADAEDIANAIYRKRNAGCGMKGDETYTITQVDSSPFVLRWDTVIQENLFIIFTATSIDGENPPDVANIRGDLAELFVPSVNERVNVNDLATDVQSVDSNTLVTNAGFSTGKEQDLVFSAVAASGVFKVNYNGNASDNINWDDNISTIESKIQAIAGLSGVNVTGTIAGQLLEVDLSSLENVATLLTITDNTLEDAGSASVAITTDAKPSTTLSPTSKQFQFVVAEENIIITEILLLPQAINVLVTQTVQFNAYGGYGDYVYEISVDNSGASINASTGEYTAGASAGTDTIRVTDELGNTKTATVTVS